MPAFQKARKNGQVSDKHKRPEITPLRREKRPQPTALVDDTPKSFIRLLQFHTLGKRLPKGLDDGSERTSKKRKRDPSKASTAAVAEPAPAQKDTVPKIQPGERLSDFAARVDQALPIIGLRQTDKLRALTIPGLKERPTKHNKRLERMQQEWRETEQRRTEAREEMLDELEEEREEQGLLWSIERKKKRKGKGPAQDDDGDPWKVLETSRADAKQRSLQDVVQAPPQLRLVKSKFKEVGSGVGVDVGNVPGSVGSLRKREELGEARRRVIDSYRKHVGRKEKGHV